MGNTIKCFAKIMSTSLPSSKILVQCSITCSNCVHESVWAFGYFGHTVRLSCRLGHIMAANETDRETSDKEKRENSIYVYARISLRNRAVLKALQLASFLGAAPERSQPDESNKNKCKLWSRKPFAALMLVG